MVRDMGANRSASFLKKPNHSRARMIFPVLAKKRCASKDSRAFSVPITSERGSISLFGGIFATQTDVPFAGKCSQWPGGDIMHDARLQAKARRKRGERR